VEGYNGQNARTLFLKLRSGILFCHIRILGPIKEGVDLVAESAYAVKGVGQWWFGLFLMDKSLKKIYPQEELK